MLMKLIRIMCLQITILKSIPTPKGQWVNLYTNQDGGKTTVYHLKNIILRWDIIFGEL